MFADESSDWNLDVGGSVTCEVCGEQPAAIHLLRVVDGAVSHTHLCPACADDMAEQTEGLALVLAVPSALRGLGKVPAPQENVSALSHEEDLFCGVCGTTLTDFRESGLLGCTNCYQVFAEELERLSAQGVEPVEHLGKMPRHGPETDNLRHEMMRLERMLRELVACERFEEAAGVRDRLAELGQRLEDEAE